MYNEKKNDKNNKDDYSTNSNKNTIAYGHWNDLVQDGAHICLVLDPKFGSPDVREFFQIH